MTSCTETNIDAIGQEYCKCREIEFQQGAMEGNKCFNEWDKKYGGLRLETSQKDKLLLLMDNCNDQYQKQDVMNMHHDFDMDELIASYCDCNAIQEAVGDTLAEICFMEFDSKYGDIVMTDQENLEFQARIKQCTTKFEFDADVLDTISSYDIGVISNDSINSVSN